MRPLYAVLLSALAAGSVGACGLNVQSPDLFLVTRTGQRSALSVLVNDDGTIRCNGASAHMLPGSLLLQARDLSSTLDNDAKAKLRIPASPNSVYFYTVTLPDGTISFPDTAAASHGELGQLEQFVLQATQSACRS